MNANTILAWVKANVFIVIFSVLILAAFIGLPLYSAKLDAKVQTTVRERQSTYNELRGIENGNVQLPAPGQETITLAGLVTERHAEAAAEYVNAIVEDAEETFRWALEHNRKGRNPLVGGVFPEMRIHEVPVKTEAMYTATKGAYERLLREIGAGQPPQFSDLKNDLIRREQQWRIERNLLNKELTDAQKQELKETLGIARMAMYANVAESVRIYASANQLPSPSWALGQAQPTATDMFYWQWNYWVTEDMLRAINLANDGSTTVQDSAVKRLISFRFLDEEERQRRRDTGGGGGGGDMGGGGGPFLQGGGAGGGNVGGGGPPQAPPPGQPSGQNQSTPQGTPIDPTVEIPWNFEYLTGRTTNGLYDVRAVRLTVIVETRAIPELLDAISQYNFMSVTDLELTPADPYTALVQGFVYGTAPVSNLTLDIETIWLRPWTAPFMPAELKRDLKIADPVAPGNQPQ